MNLLYLANLSYDKNLGVYKKIKNQLNCFTDNGIETLLIDDKYMIKNKLIGKFISLIPFCSKIKYDKIFELLINSSIDVIYLRFQYYFDYNTIRFLKKVKKFNSNIKIIIEFPDYPYLFSFPQFYNKPLFLKDFINKNKAKNYIDIAATCAIVNKDINGIKTLYIKNGINVNKESKRKITVVNKISLISVSVQTYYHGYDRIIKGLGEYYKKGGKRKIILHMVGDGEVSGEYKKLANEYNLNENVIFYGNKHGKELDEIYDKSNIAIGSLGLHRIDPKLIASTLKTREYAAKGLPVIASGKVDIFDDDYKYYLEFPADETPVDIEKVIEFYDEIYPDEKSFQAVHDEIRAFAEKTVDMNITMKPVIDYLKGAY